MICCNIYSALTPTKKQKCVDFQKFFEQQQYVMSYSYLFFSFYCYSFSFCAALSHCEYQCSVSMTFWYESECGSGSSVQLTWYMRTIYGTFSSPTLKCVEGNTAIEEAHSFFISSSLGLTSPPPPPSASLFPNSYSYFSLWELGWEGT